LVEREVAVDLGMVHFRETHSEQSVAGSGSHNGRLRVRPPASPGNVAGPRGTIVEEE